jgi:hypothetical protein
VHTLRLKHARKFQQLIGFFKLAGDVQVDDAYQGGEKPGKRGRGAASKTAFVVAVETRDGRPIYTQLRCIPAFTKEAIKDYALRNIEPGSRVLSDGLSCFNLKTAVDPRRLPAGRRFCNIAVW